MSWPTRCNLVRLSGAAIMLAILLLWAALAARAEGQQHGNEQLNRVVDYTINELTEASDLAKWQHTSYRPDYYDFSETQLAKQELLYYIGAYSETETVPQQVVLNSLELEIKLNVTKSLADDGQALKCSGYISTPAILLAGSVWENNLWEFLFNDAMSLWQTAAELMLIDKDRYLTKNLPPSPEEAPFVLIQARQDAYTSPWSYLFNYLTPHQLLMEQVEGMCFSRLIVISTSIMRFMSDHPVSETDRPAYDENLKWFMKSFRRWMLRVEDLHQRAQGRPRPAALTDSVPYTRPRVLLSSRPVIPGRPSRAVTNEADIVRYIEEGYDVNVTLVYFKNPMEDAMHMVLCADLLLGMHGAGLSHSLWLRPGTHMLQLAPYGFQPQGKPLIRGQYYEETTAALDVSYSQWVSPHAEKAIFHKEHFTNPEDFLPHPPDNMPRPVDWSAPTYWIYQSTEVDMDSFGPVLDDAMRQINVPRKAQVLVGAI